MDSVTEGVSNRKNNGNFKSKERKFGQNARRLVRLVSQAFLNPREPPKNICLNTKLRYITVYIPWDIQEFYLERVKAGRDKKGVKFTNPSFGCFSEPLTVVDNKGRIVLWYLPGLLSSEHQVGV
jgi:hypothetical protein